MVYRVLAMADGCTWDIGWTMCTLERGSISRERACKWKVLAFHDDDKYCIERAPCDFHRRRAVERYDHVREENLPLALRGFLFSHGAARGRAGYRAFGKLAKLYISYAFFERCTYSTVSLSLSLFPFDLAPRIRINWIFFWANFSRAKPIYRFRRRFLGLQGAIKKLTVGIG